MSSIKDLTKNIDEVDKLRENYSKIYFGRKLDRKEIANARQIILSIHNIINIILKNWIDYANSVPHDDEIINKMNKRFMKIKDISLQISTLIHIANEGSRIMSKFELANSQVAHYQRQCSDQSQGNVILKEEADNFHISISFAINRLRNDLKSKNARINLLTLFSQTILTNRINSYTLILIILTIIVIILTGLSLYQSNLAALTYHK